MLAVLCYDGKVKMSEKIGLFTGSFDPLTSGHMDLIRRASRHFDSLLVGVFYNPDKPGFLSLEEREDLVREAVKGLENVQVIVAQKKLVAELAKEHGVTSLIRGIRNSQDLNYEARFDFYNKGLDPDLETLYLLAKPEYQFVSSSGVRELLAFDGDISPYVPKHVKEVLQKHHERK